MDNSLRIAIAQLSFLVGDIEGNAEKMIAAIQHAKQIEKADVILFPELALSGYPPEDLLFQQDFGQRITQALQKLVLFADTITIIVGHPHYQQGLCYNAASVLQNKQIIATYHKQKLPNYGIFDEVRYFTPGEQSCVIIIKDIPCAITICEDLWHPEPAHCAVAEGAQLILCINASPFEINKNSVRKSLLQARIEENHVPIIYAHCVGGQDELVFDGGSMILDAQGQLVYQADFFKEHLFSVDVFLESEIIIKAAEPFEFLGPISEEAQAYNALVLCLRDYVEKNNFPGALVGLSGGIDSALTLAIAVDALGPNRVRAVIMPSRYTSSLSLVEAKKLAESLNVYYNVLSIESLHTAFLSTLAEDPETLLDSIVDQNIQTRCRMILLFALSNQTGSIVLNTSNKSELAMGYSTIYGDLAGGFAALKDVYKTFVYRLAEYRNSLSPIIPSIIIERAPTAELAPNQTDQDTLPPYPILDLILELYLEQNKSVSEIIAAGFDESTVRYVARMVKCSEYKRRQAPVGCKITPRAFGRDWRYPITSKSEGRL